MIVKRRTITREERIRGSLMEKAIRQLPAPSTVAASSSERSTAWSAA